MAAYNIQQILGYVTLTGLIQATKSGIPDVLPPKLMNTTRQVLGDSGRYTQVTGERRVSRITKYGSSALEANLRNIAVKDVKLMHTFERQPIPPLVMQQLRQYDSYEVQKMGMQEVARQVKEFGRKFNNLRIATVLQVLATGRLYVDGNGNLLPNSSGAVETYDFGMNANNQGQLNGIITASWANPNTNIPVQLLSLRQRAAQLTGYDIKHAFYGKNVPTYFTNNDYVIDYLSRQPQMSVDWLKDAGQIPNGLFGLEWHEVVTPFYEDANGTNQQIWDNDLVVFTPEISDEWWEILEGSYLVPTTINIQNDAVQAVNSLKVVYGMFAYGQASHDPVGVNTFMGDTALPVIKVPDAIYQADVAF